MGYFGPGLCTVLLLVTSYNAFIIVASLITATAYGAGVYFAVKADYSSSSTYSPADANGDKHIFLALVLTGEYTVGHSSLRVPPPKDPKKSNVILFDSVVNTQSNPIMFVIFYDAQCYPEYLITFK